MKSIAGRLAYLLGGVQTLLDFDPIRLTLHADPGGHRIETDAAPSPSATLDRSAAGA